MISSDLTGDGRMRVPTSVVAGVLRVEPEDPIEFPVVADVVRVRVRVHHLDREPCQLLGHRANIRDAHASIEQQCAIVADDQI